MRKFFLVFLCVLLCGVGDAFSGRVTNCEAPSSDGKCGAGCYFSNPFNVCERCPAGTYKSETMDSCQPCSGPKNVDSNVVVDFFTGDAYTGYTTDSCPWKLACPGGMFWSYSGGKGRCKACGDGSDSVNGNCYDVEVCQDSDICFISGNNDSSGNIDVGTLSATGNENKVCVPRTYNVLLNKNTGLTELNGYVYENKEFTVTCNDRTISAENYLQPSQPVKIFSGYATESNTCNREIFHEDGSLAVEPDFFNSDKELYACWENMWITVYYYFGDDTEPEYTQSCRVDDKKSTVECFFEDHSGAGFAGTYFQSYTCEYKNAEGARVPCPEASYQIGDDVPLLGTEIYVKGSFNTCPAGYYCEDSNFLVECPIGTTSDAASSSIEDCYMPSGQSGTKFCDKNGCFYLPTGIGNISYNPS